MPNIEHYENLVLGSGGSGKFIGWTFGEGARSHRDGRARSARRRLSQCRLPAEQEHHLFRQESSPSPGAARNSA